MKKLLLLLAIITLLASCSNTAEDIHDKGFVIYLPKGEYVIWNTGSRHIVKCLNNNGDYYWLNDSHFDENNIPGYDAHKYRNKTLITIK